jgi:hypothetical protein
LRERLGYRMDRKVDRLAWENDGQIERQVCEQKGRTYLEGGFGKGWKDKLTDRLMKRMEDKLRDRLMSRNDGHIKRQACEKDGKAYLAIFRSFSFCFNCFTSFRSDFAVSLRCKTSENIPFFSLPSETKFSLRLHFSLRNRKRRRSL